MSLRLIEPWFRAAWRRCLPLLQRAPALARISLLVSGAAAQTLTFNSVPVNASFGQTLIAAGDFNRDGNPDIAFIAQQTITVLPGHGDGTFGTPIVSSV